MQFSFDKIDHMECFQREDRVDPADLERCRASKCAQGRKNCRFFVASRFKTRNKNWRKYLAKFGRKNRELLKSQKSPGKDDLNGLTNLHFCKNRPDDDKFAQSRKAKGAEDMINCFLRN